MKGASVLTLTENAADVIRHAVDSSDLPEGAGLRLQAAAGEAEGTVGLAAALTDAPEPSDDIVNAEGARVFVDPAVSLQLADKVLDAKVEPDGAVTFGFHSQGTI